MPFKKGQSGNPRGKSKKDYEFKRLCEKHSPEALEVILHEMRNSEDPAVRSRNAMWVCEQAHGKAKQQVEATGEGGGPLVAVLRDA